MEFKFKLIFTIEFIWQDVILFLLTCFGPIAQLARAFAWHAKGQEFEPP